MGTHQTIDNMITPGKTGLRRIQHGTYGCRNEDIAGGSEGVNRHGDTLDLLEVGERLQVHAKSDICCETSNFT